MTFDPGHPDSAGWTDAGEPVDPPEIARLFDRMRAGAEADELAGTEALVAAMMAAMPVDLAGRRAKRSRRSKMAGRTVIVVGTLLVGSSAAAATGNLPDRAQSAVSRWTSHIGLDLPDPSPPAPAPTLPATTTTLPTNTLPTNTLPPGPDTTAGDETSTVPETSTAPETVTVPEASTVPESTMAPETTAAPATTMVPETTTAPENPAFDSPATPHTHLQDGPAVTDVQQAPQTTDAAGASETDTNETHTDETDVKDKDKDDKQDKDKQDNQDKQDKETKDTKDARG